jgi:hypothetical protein
LVIITFETRPTIASKKHQLIERAKQTVRTPKPPRLIEAEAQPKKVSYRAVVVSLYSSEADWIDEVTRALQQAGNPKANRSLVVSEVILRLQESLKEKTPDIILKDFIDHRAKRAQQG